MRIAFSHGAGSLAIILPRLQHAWEQMAPVRQMLDAPPRELARRFFVDDLVYDRDTIRHLMELYGPTQVFAGTDYPFAIMDRQPGQRLAELGLDEATHRLLSQDNALRWLGRETGLHDPAA